MFARLLVLAHVHAHRLLRLGWPPVDKHGLGHVLDLGMRGRGGSVMIDLIEPTGAVQPLLGIVA